jgi:hypothetical protein
LILLMETLAGGGAEVGQATTPPVERCPARFRAARDEYLAACRRRGNAEASVVTKKRAADQFLAYLEEVGRATLEEVQARDLAGFWARRQRRGYAPKTTGLLRSSLADFLRHLHQGGQIREDLAGRLPPQRYPRRGESVPHPWTAGEVRLVLGQIDRQSAIGLEFVNEAGQSRCEATVVWFDRRCALDESAGCGDALLQEPHTAGVALLGFGGGEVRLAASAFEQHCGCRQFLHNAVVDFVAEKLPVSLGQRERLRQAAAFRLKVRQVVIDGGHYSPPRTLRCSG